MEPIICENCGNPLPDQATFCPNCGTSVETNERSQSIQSTETNRCPRCQHQQVTKSASFCEKCGYPLDVHSAISKTREPSKTSVIKPEHPAQDSAEASALQPIYTPSEPGDTSRPNAPPKPPSSTRSKIRRPLRLIIAFLGIALFATTGYFVWQWWRGISQENKTVPMVDACQPIKPDEQYQISNPRDLSGEIIQDTYFAAGEEYSIASNSTLTIKEGATLLIEPGARLKFGQGSKMVVEGTLLACGRSSRRILFTADSTTGYPGFWSGVEFHHANPDTVIGHVTIEFAGKDAHAALWMDDTDLHIEDLKFDNNQWYALSMNPDSYPRLRDPLTVENGPLGWEIRGGDMTTRQTWHSEAPLIVNGMIEVREKASLTIPAGMWIKFQGRSAIRFYGDVLAEGTNNQPIVFTAVNELGEESAPEPEAGNWAGLLFYGREGRARFSHVEIRYAGNPDLSGCVYLSNAAPIFENVSITNCGSYSISSDLASEPEIENLTLDQEDTTLQWELRAVDLEGTVSRTLSPVFITNQNSAITPVITGWVGVTDNASLTIEPGMILLFRGGKDAGLWSSGKLKAVGTERDPIILTSWQDPSAGGIGDTSPGDWGGLHLYDSQASDTNIDFVEIRYGGANNNGCLRLENASPAIGSMEINECNWYPVSSDAASQPIVESLRIQENQYANQWEIRKSSLEERKDWQWDSLKAQDGTPIVRLLTGLIQIKSDATLTLQPGLVLKFSQDAGLLAQGSLKAEGTDAQPIIMTSWRDPYGGGKEQGAQPGDWGGIALDGSEMAKSLAHVELRYAGNARRGVSCLSLNKTSPRLSNIWISHCAYYPISSDLASDPTVDGIALEENQPANEWAIRESTLEKGLQRTWPALAQMDNGNPITRISTGWLSVQEGAKLTLDPGTVLKFANGKGFWIGGTLLAEGNPDKKIIFTSWRDPSFGQESGVQAGDWVGLAFERAQGDTRLAQVEIRYAGASRNPRGAITLVETSPNLSNISVRDSAWYPISIDLESNPNLTNIGLQANSPSDAVEIRTSQLETAGEKVLPSWMDIDGKALIPVVTGQITIGGNATLRIESGTVLKFLQDAKLVIRGGVLASDAVLTSYHDDEYGGDTDGGVSGERKWSGIEIYGRNLSQFENTIIRYAQTGLWMENAAPNLKKLSIEDSWGAAISADFLSNPQIDGISLARNGINGLVLRGGNLPEGETRWDILGSVSSQIARVVQETLTVGANARLRIAPGVVIKFAPETGLFIEGQLNVGDRDAEPVVFTAIEDDQYGGDSNNQSSEGRRGSWLGLMANPNDTNAQVSLFNTRIRFAVVGLHLTNLPGFEYYQLIIENSQLNGLSCDESFIYDPMDEEIIFINNGVEIDSCPSPDR